MHRSGHRRALASSANAGDRGGSSTVSSTAETITAPVLEAIAKRKKVYTATYNREAKPSVVILGSGWAGYQLARSLDKSKYSVTVVSDRNHFLFTPLLPSTTVRSICSWTVDGLDT